MHVLKSRFVLSALIFLITLSASISSILYNRQLEYMGGMAEEYFELGLRWHQSGSFSYDGTAPVILRPPGYPFFISSVLKLWGGVPDKTTIFRSKEEVEQALHKAYNAVYLAQCLLLSLSAVILFLWMHNHLRPGIAFVFALLFGCNPYMLILTGLLHYGMLHIFLTIISCFVLSRAIESANVSSAKMIFAGLFWGLTALVRPVTLILPMFVFFMLAIKFKFSWKPVLKTGMAFTLGMVVVIAPYTFRNYSLTNRFIPVNAQSGIAFWASTVQKTVRDPNHYKWWAIWYKDGMMVFYKTTKAPQYDNKIYLNNIIQLEDEFKKEAVNNFIHQPDVFFYNFAQNFATFNLDINSVFIKLFQMIQDPNKEVDKDWFEIGNVQNFYSSTSANVFELFINLLTLFSFLGIIIAIYKRDLFLLVPGLTYLCICIAHSITWMDLMYYYIKMPFLFLFAGYFVDKAGNYLYSLLKTSRNKE